MPGLLILSRKVPTLVAYRNGSPVAYGAEALEFADDEDHEVAQWFKVDDFIHIHLNSDFLIT